MKKNQKQINNKITSEVLINVFYSLFQKIILKILGRLIKLFRENVEGGNFEIVIKKKS